jgi:hypothetical protein
MIWGHREETLWRWRQCCWRDDLYYGHRKVTAAASIDWQRAGNSLQVLLDVGYCLDAQTCNPSD